MLLPDGRDTALVGLSKAALPSGWISDAAEPDNPIGFDAYICSPGWYPPV